MSFVYVIVENSGVEPDGGGLWPKAYSTFEEAKAAIIARYKDLVDETEEAGDDSPRNLVEATSGFTTMYIEKEYNFYIHKLSIPPSGGKRLLKSRRKTLRRGRRV